MQKKLILVALLSLTCGLAAAANGQQASTQATASATSSVTGDQTISVNGCWRNGKYVMC